MNSRGPRPAAADAVWNYSLHDPPLIPPFRQCPNVKRAGQCCEHLADPNHRKPIGR